MKNDKKIRPTVIGGQALIEGVMMKGPEKPAAVIRRTDGTHAVREEEIGKQKRITKIPFVRGMFVFYESMKYGISCLMYSAEAYDGFEEEEPTKLDLWIERKFGAERAEKAMMTFALVLGVAMPVGLFILLPTLLAGFFAQADIPTIARNLLEGGIRIIIFMIFLASVSRMKDMRRVFAYHGAEHKTIFCYEYGLPLTVENVRGMSRFHPRCGTSFLFVVVIISILVFSWVHWTNPLIRVLLRLALLPVVVGISYEINRFAGRHDNLFTRAVRYPGMLMQRFTTYEPEDYMIEVAIDALTRVIPEDGSDRW